MGDHLWIKDDSMVLTSYPPKYAWECVRCGAVATTEGGMPNTYGCEAHASFEKLRTMIGESGFTLAQRVQLENLVDDAELQLKLSEGRRKTERNNFEQVCKQRDRLKEQRKVLQAEVGELREKVGRMAETDARWEAMRHELESTIAERDECYMELPVDADGVPIRPGDDVEYNGHVEHVNAVGGSGFTSAPMFAAETCRHVKPDTVEDVLCELSDVAMAMHSVGFMPIGEIRKYVERIRKVVQDGN